MKSLKPSLREKKRYLFVRGKNLKENIEKSILDFIGVLGMAKVGFYWVEHKENSAIIAVNRGSLNDIRASFVAWPEKICVEKVSGTLKKLRKESFSKKN